MAFQLKDFQSIVASMVNYVRGATTKLTDFNRGSGIRTLLEAVAVEMDQMYQEMFSGLREGIETSVFRSFDLELFDDETFLERQARFARYVQTLARATIDAIAAGAETAVVLDGNGDVIERVHSAMTYEPYLDDTAQPVGFAQCYIHNGATATSAALVIEAQKIIDGYIDGNGKAVPGWKGAGLPVTVIAATDVSIDADYEITVTSGDTAEKEAAALDAIEQFITDLPIGTDFEPYCGASAVRIAGVGCVRATSPAGTVAIVAGEKAIPGTITVTAVSS